MKKTIFTILLLALSFTLSYGQSGGDGTVGDPYQISNYADLQWLQTASSEWGKHFLQTADIDASATATDGWSPLTFSGYFDGDGYAIDQLTFSAGSYAGFIGTMSAGEVKNLGLTNVSITKTSGDYGAALVAYLPGGTVDNCFATGNIIYNTSSTTYNLGGLIGRSNADATVSNSYSEVNISYSNAAPINVGGFVGYNKGGSITNCYATGNVQGHYAIGGFAGENLNGGDITKSYSTGNATATGNGIGGFIGVNNNGMVSECYSKGNASGDYRVGGFIGYNYAVGTASNCYSFGEVTGSNASGAGGFCGVNKASILEYCYSTGVSNSKGFVGDSYGTDVAVTSCFFDSTAGLVDSHAEGKTTAEMKTQATFTDWDFSSIWKVEGNYPNLINNPNSDLEPKEDIDDPLPEGTELIANYGFNDGLNGWLFNNADSLANATYSLDQSSVINGPNSVMVHMDTCAGGSPSGRTALYTQVPVIGGKEYHITFKMKATKAISEWDLYWSFYDSVKAGSYYEPSDWSLATWSMEKDSIYKFELNYTPDFTDTDAYFSIDFGYMATGAIDFWIDDIHLIKIKQEIEDVQDPLPEGTELVTNYNFNDDLNGWSFNNADSLANATYSLDESYVINGPNSAMVHMDTCAGGSPSGRTALYTQVPVEEGKEYHITFKMKASKSISDWDLYWSFYNSVEDGSYYAPSDWSLATWSMEKDSIYKFELNYTPDFTDADAYFSIDFGYMATGAIDFWVDDVHLIKLKEEDDVQDPLPEGTELITNYNFNDGLNGWLFNNADSLSNATYSLDESSVINGPNSATVHMDTCAGGSPSGRTALYTQVPVEEGQEYYITFKMKATKAISDWDLYWSFYDSVEAGSYYAPSDWSLATWSMAKDSIYKFELNYTPDFTDADAYFSIDFGYMATGPVDFWIDDVHLIKLKEAEPSCSSSLTFNLSDPRDEYVIAEDSLNFGLDTTWTMEGWFKFANFDSPGGENHIMRLGAQLFVNGGYLKVQAGGNYVAGTTELVTDKWYHIAYVRTPSEVTVYLDGVSEIVAPGADEGASAQRFLIGSYGTPSTDYNFAGTLDEIRLWNVARTETEINTAKDVELTGTEDGLVIYYNFNDGVGSTVVDIAGEDNNGALFNMADSNWSKDNPFDRPVPPDELPLPEGTELLTNNYFNDGLTNWDLNLSVQSAATLALDNSGVLESDNSAKVHVKSTYSSGSWKNQFRQTEMEGTLIDKHSYHVQYRIKASKAVSGIYAVVQQNHGSFSDIYSKEISLLADSMVSVVDTFVCSETDSMVTFAFNLGTASVKDVEFWFDAVHLIDVGELVGVEEEEAIPTVYALRQNYPNPFNPTTVISFALPKASDVQLSVYNILGEKVTELISNKMVAGNHSVNFNATNLASGVYIYRIQAGSFVSVKKMLLLK